MKRRTFLKLTTGAAVAAGVSASGINIALAAGKNIAYLTPSTQVPFWRYLSKGLEMAVSAKGYSVQVFDSHHNGQTQLHNAQDAIARGVDGIVLSPTDSTTAPSVLGLADRANIPVVIGDIGTDSGKYASFIISNNYQGAHDVGMFLAHALKKKGWEDGSVGIIAIPQARINGRQRTKGFLDGLKEGGFTGNQAGMRQMRSLTQRETFKFVQDMLTANPNLRGLFVQTDRPTLGALRAIKAARREGQVLVAAFDGIPEFVDLIKSGKITVDGMQQPHLMGVNCGQSMLKTLAGKAPEKRILVPILTVTSNNIEKLVPTIKKTVFSTQV